MQDREKAFIKTLAQSKSTFGIVIMGAFLGVLGWAKEAFFKGLHLKEIGDWIFLT